MLEGKKVEIRTNEGFAPIPMDKYTVQITDVNLATQLKYQSSEEEEVLNYQFQILDEKPMPKVEGEKDTTTRGRFLWKRCRLSLNSRSWLGKLAEACEGRQLTKEEAEKFDPESIVGKQLDVMVEQKPDKKDPTIIWNNIVTFSKATKELKALPQEERNTKPVEKTTTGVPDKAPDAESENFVDELKEEEEEKKLEKKLEKIKKDKAARKAKKTKK